jgi:hypothetical protein
MFYVAAHHPSRTYIILSGMFLMSLSEVYPSCGESHTLKNHDHAQHISVAFLPGNLSHGVIEALKGQEQGKGSFGQFLGEMPAW